MIPLITANKNELEARFAGKSVANYGEDDLVKLRATVWLGLFFSEQKNMPGTTTRLYNSELDEGRPWNFVRGIRMGVAIVEEISRDPEDFYPRFRGELARHAVIAFIEPVLDPVNQLISIKIAHPGDTDFPNVKRTSQIVGATASLNILEETLTKTKPLIDRRISPIQST